jgi:phosphatidylserine decarboxylase
LIAGASCGRIGAVKVPFTRYGLPQAAIFPAVIAGIAVFCLFVAIRWCCGWICVAAWIVEGMLLVLLVWVLSFFRDPERQIPRDSNVLLSPADGTVTAVDVIEDAGGKAIRIGIFLSIFNVHINRAPCAAVVEEIRYRKGRFINAQNGESSQVNESNDVVLRRVDEPADRIVVRQISGAIARRIVCAVQTGEKLEAGQRFGMIKFGSRTELIFPARPEAHCVVKQGDKVKAGLNVLARYL